MQTTAMWYTHKMNQEHPNPIGMATCDEYATKNARDCHRRRRHSKKVTNITCAWEAWLSRRTHTKKQIEITGLKSNQIRCHVVAEKELAQKPSGKGSSRTAMATVLAEFAVVMPRVAEDTCKISL